jgi:hypothetical protein
VLKPLVNSAPNAVLARLLISYAPADLRLRQRLAWLLDERLADVVRAAREPMIGAIRMAWWRDALVRDDLTKGRGEPLIEALRALPMTDADKAAIDRMIDGWSLLVGDKVLDGGALHDFAKARGGGLFHLLAGADGATQAAALDAAGGQWALWDLAGHVTDEPLARAAIAVAHEVGAGGGILPSRRALKPMRLAAQVAQIDIRAGRLPVGGFAPRHYFALLRHALLG